VAEQADGLSTEKGPEAPEQDVQTREDGGHQPL
jgi:hypothetical protein